MSGVKDLGLTETAVSTWVRNYRILTFVGADGGVLDGGEPP
jgi:hypothetical protein